MRYTVQAVIFNEEGQVLGVSRKDNHSDFGLVGGKVDEEDYNAWNGHTPLERALVRETKEETGLDINIATSEMVFSIHKDGFMGHTYLIYDWSGEIHTDEPHVVKWTTFDELIAGSFGKYNKMVAESLTDMGIKFK
jgi:8-oxo-dGTP pyrophosphatase MutT (NUDIX family)